MNADLARAQEIIAGCRMIVFDVDDTLIDTFPTSHKRSSSAAIANGLPELPLELFRETYGAIAFPDCVSTWYPDADLDRFLAAYEIARAQHVYRSHVDCARLATQLDRSGLSYAVLTNSNHKSTLAKLSQIGFLAADPVGRIYSKEQLPRSKPHPDAFRPLLEHWKFDPHTIVYVGDSAMDAIASREAGLQFIGVSTGPRPIDPDLLSLPSVAAILECLAPA